MALQADEQGFLVGTPIDLRAAVNKFEEIRQDVKAIRAALGSIHDESIRISRVAERSSVAVPPTRSGSDRQVRPIVTAAPGARRSDSGPIAYTTRPGATPRPTEGPSMKHQTVAEPGRRAAPETERRRDQTRALVAEPRRRDVHGRFTGKDSSGGRSRVTGADEQLIGQLSTRIKDAVSRVGDLEEADPTVKAFNEVAQPISRGWNAIFGDRKEKKQDGWFRRIFGELKAFRKEESTYNKAAKKSLKAIEDKTSAGVSGGGGGLFSGLSSGFRSLGLFGRLLTGMFRHSGGLGRLLAGGFRFLGRGLLKRFHILGGLLGLGALGSNLYADDPNLTPEQQRESKFKAGGKFAGELVGGALGLFGGLPGAVIGAIIGDKVGEMVGGWLAEFDWAAIGDTITAKWTQVTDWVSSTWNNAVVEPFSAVATKIESAWSEVTTKIETAWDSVTERFNAFLESFSGFLKDKYGIDLPEIKKTVETAAQSAVEAAGEKLNEANAAVKAKTGLDIKAGIRKGIDTAKKITQTAGEGVGMVKDWVLGQTSKTFESGKGGAGTVSSGKGDHGGASYGTYQLSSAKGTLQRFLDSTPYGEAFKGLTPGTRAFNQKWKEIAAQDPAFGQAQHDFMKRTHFDPMMAKLQTAGIDLSKRGAAVQDMVWSVATQFGPGHPLIINALKGLDHESMTNAQIIEAVQDYKIQHNAGLFQKSSAAVRAGTLARAHAEKQKLLELDARVSAPQIVSAPPVVTPKAPAPVAVAEPQPVPVPLGGSSRPNLTVTIPPPDVGQDVRDRGIAHIATGGISRRT